MPPGQAAQITLRACGLLTTCSHAARMQRLRGLCFAWQGLLLSSSCPCCGWGGGPSTVPVPMLCGAALGWQGLSEPGGSPRGHHPPAPSAGVRCVAQLGAHPAPHPPSPTAWPPVSLHLYLCQGTCASGACWAQQDSSGQLEVPVKVGTLLEL